MHFFTTSVNYFGIMVLQKLYSTPISHVLTPHCKQGLALHSNFYQKSLFKASLLLYCLSADCGLDSLLEQQIEDLLAFTLVKTLVFVRMEVAIE